MTNEEAKEILERVKSYAEDDRKDERAALALDIALWLLKRERFVRAVADCDDYHAIFPKLAALETWEKANPKP